MSSANSPDNNCQGGVCETTFKPARQAKASFENLKIIAGDLLTKVKETLTGEHDVIEDTEHAGERNRLARMQQQTIHEKTIAEPDAHVSRFSAPGLVEEAAPPAPPWTQAFKSRLTKIWLYERDAQSYC